MQGIAISFDLLCPEIKHYSAIPVSSHDCLLCRSVPARGSPISSSMSPPGPRACCNRSEDREPEKARCGGKGEYMAGGSTGQLSGGREVATELTVLKIAKSKIPGALMGVGCGSWEG